ncbi:aliphatic sulfonate ABC transporter substrate-binding protein [Gluconacetobacter tumulisoli]|uniref:Putative aliphatic sulfonates-binding protein n=2 Tax=Gluconacetobacter tumulisoli TaxID=1286189 RepID=A0A7W4PNJ0_9PROT|nr:aliphatic sulfonate ABC transporter substrate-binding protein [Gluconacetobacter tumulisoli]MBB2200936.1 aliphatic sulfonate ABC transporter substrate-binding protein [Gluconacetobacter tumulisoli]
MARTGLAGRRAVLAAGLSLLAVGHGARAAARTVRVGYQRYGTLIVLKHSGLLEQVLAPLGHDVVWSEFVAGPQMLQALAAGAIDFAETGDAPPVFAQAAWPDRLVYVGHGARAPQGEAILVRASGPITQVADLKGRSIAFNRGSNVHYLVLAALAKAGLTIRDVHVVNLVPASARAAFDMGRIDAWAIWDPYLAAEQATGGARVLADADGLTGNRQFLLASRAFAEADPPAVRAVLQALSRSHDWARTHQPDLVAAIASDTGLPPDVIRVAVARLPLAVSPMDDGVAAEQQAIADLLSGNGLLPARVKVRDAMWTG